MKNDLKGALQEIEDALENSMPYGCDDFSLMEDEHQEEAWTVHRAALETIKAIREACPEKLRPDMTAIEIGMNSSDALRLLNQICEEKK